MVSVNHLYIYHYLSIYVAINCVIIYVSINLLSVFLSSIYHPPIICVSHLSSTCATYHLCIYRSISHVSITYVLSIFLSSLYQSIYKLWIICLCIYHLCMCLSTIHPSIHPWGGLSDTQNHNSGSHKKNVFNGEMIDFSICAVEASTMIE